MMHDVIKLLSITNTVNNAGDSISVPVEREVFADCKSIRQTEFYQAAATGLKPEIMFEVWSIEYAGEKQLKYEGKVYTIVRTFSKGELTELICTGLVSKGAP